jgi:hypothetical protein
VFVTDSVAVVIVVTHVAYGIAIGVDLPVVEVEDAVVFTVDHRVIVVVRIAGIAEGVVVVIVLFRVGYRGAVIEVVVHAVRIRIAGRAAIAPGACILFLGGVACVSVRLSGFWFAEAGVVIGRFAPARAVQGRRLSRVGVRTAAQ